MNNNNNNSNKNPNTQKDIFDMLFQVSERMSVPYAAEMWTADSRHRT